MKYHSHGQERLISSEDKKKSIMEVELYYTNFKQMPIKIFVQYLKESKTIESETAKDILLLSLVSNLSQEQIRELDLAYYNELLSKLDFNLPLADKIESFQFNDITYSVDYNPFELKVKQFEQIELLINKYEDIDRIIPVLTQLIHAEDNRQLSKDVIAEMPVEIVWQVATFFLQREQYYNNLIQIYGYLHPLIIQMQASVK